MKKQNKFLVLLLTIGVFGIINTEMGIIGILPTIAKVFNVLVATAIFLISGFALRGWNNVTFMFQWHLLLLLNMKRIKKER